MSRLLPDDEALLRQARLGREPTRADRSRIKGKIAARIMLGLAGSALSTSAAAGGGGTVVAGATMAAVTKALAGLLVVGGIAGAGVVALRSSHPARGKTTTRSALAVTAPPSSLSVPSAQSPQAALLRDSPPLAPPPSAPVPLLPLAAAAQPVAAATPRKAAGHAAAAPQSVVKNAGPPAAVDPAPATSAPALPSGPTTVAAEAELLRQADASLRAGDAARALALVNQDAASFPNGILAEEREAERVTVLCALGRETEARESAAAFLRGHERSPLAVRVRRSCAAP